MQFFFKLTFSCGFLPIFILIAKIFKSLNTYFHIYSVKEPRSDVAWQQLEIDRLHVGEHTTISRDVYLILVSEMKLTLVSAVTETAGYQ